jgi:hypothetical protein
MYQNLNNVLTFHCSNQIFFHQMKKLMKKDSHEFI